MPDMKTLTFGDVTYNIVDEAARASIEELSTREAIPSGANLNDYVTPGEYYASTNEIAATVVNSPTVNNFIMYVLKRNNTYHTQVIIDTFGALFIRSEISTGWPSNWESYVTETKLSDAISSAIQVGKTRVAIPSSADLNLYTTVGEYYASTGEIAATLHNCPTTTNFMLSVFKRNNTNVTQVIIDAYGTLYIRSETASGWTNEWKTGGADGFSPEITIDQALVGFEKTVTVTIKSEKDGEVVEESFSISDGADGQDGEQGPKGDKGDKGDTGADGKSAYAYAQDGGYTGTESEFADKLADDNDVFYVTVTQSGDGGTLSSDKTVEEIIEAYNAGRTVVCKIPFETTAILLPLVLAVDGAAMFICNAGGTTYTAMITNEEVTTGEIELATVDNVPTSLPNPHNLSFTGAATVTYNGSAPKAVYIPTVDKASVTNALGYTPADVTDVDQIKEQVQITPGQVTEQARDIMGETDHGWTASTYVNYTTGATSTHDSYTGSVNYIEIPEGGRLFVTYATEYLTYPTVAFYDSNHNYISGEYPKLSSTSDREEYGGQYGYFYTIPENAKYFRVSYQSTLEYHTDILLIAETVVGTQVQIPNLVLAKTPIAGKTVVCFGDSLIGMYRGEDSATAFITDETGATVYNVGFGGCRMAVHPTSGYSAFSMWALAKAISENDWTTQDAQVSGGSAYFPEQLALLKYIDFTKVDIAVIHYGTNDFTAGNGVEIDNVDDPDDYNTLCGALRYSVEKLLTTYPKLRIYISLPCFRYWTADNGSVTYPDSYTNSSGHTLTDFVEALRAVAAEYNLPVIDSYYGMGVNRVNATSFLQSDGTHHNADGRERFGRFIGASLVSQQTSGKSGMDVTAVNALIDTAIGSAIGGAY